METAARSNLEPIVASSIVEAASQNHAKPRRAL